MAYYLKKTKLKGRVYLSICESFYSQKTKQTAQKCHKSLGSVETLQKQGMADPIAYYQAKVDTLNSKRKQKGKAQITKHSASRYLGYFPLKSIMEKLNIKHYVDFFHLHTDFKFSIYEILSSQIYARAVKPCSKLRTYNEVLPNLYQSYDYSYDQLLCCLDFMGENYSKFIEIFTRMTDEIYGLDTNKTYFDCTNFYFEIDREDDFRRKDPSKENRKDPIVGLGLLLDHNQIPIGMKVFPGNQSEKPVLPKILSELKRKNNIQGRTVQVADKGLNCGQNIALAKQNGDGYIFSKSVRQLPQVELAWVLNKNDWQEVKNASGECLYRFKSCVDKYPYQFEYNGVKNKMDFTEKRLLTYNPTLAAKKRHEIKRMVEKARGLSHALAKRKDYGECGKYVNFTDADGGKARVSINQDAIDKDMQLAGYNMIVTSEIEMTDHDIYETYHNLWRIEESFRLMKSDLDARPVYLQKEARITGHFLICYLTVLLERILQFKILDNKYPTSTICKFIKDFTIAKSESKHINTSIGNQFISELAELTKLPLTDYYLTDTNISKILNHELQHKRPKSNRK